MKYWLLQSGLLAIVAVPDCSMSRARHAQIVLSGVEVKSLRRNLDVVLIVAACVIVAISCSLVLAVHRRYPYGNHSQLIQMGHLSTFVGLRALLVVYVAFGRGKTWKRWAIFLLGLAWLALVHAIARRMEFHFVPGRASHLLESAIASIRFTSIVACVALLLRPLVGEVSREHDPGQASLKISDILIITVVIAIAFWAQRAVLESAFPIEIVGTWQDVQGMALFLGMSVAPALLLLRSGVVIRLIAAFLVCLTMYGERIVYPFSGPKQTYLVAWMVIAIPLCVLRVRGFLLRGSMLEKNAKPAGSVSESGP